MSGTFQRQLISPSSPLGRRPSGRTYPLANLRRRRGAERDHSQTGACRLAKNDSVQDLKAFLVRALGEDGRVGTDGGVLDRIDIVVVGRQQVLTGETGRNVK